MIRWKLRTVMADRKMTNKELAETMGVHRNTIHQLKDDHPTMIRLEHLEHLCKILKCGPSDLFEIEREPSESYQGVTMATFKQ